MYQQTKVQVYENDKVKLPDALILLVTSFPKITVPILKQLSSLYLVLQVSKKCFGNF